MTPHAKIEQPVSTTKLTVPLAVVGAIILALATGFAAYYGTVNAQAQSVNSVKDELTQKINDIATVAAGKIADTNVSLSSEKSRSDQFEKRLDRFENKIDVLLQHSGVNPAAAVFGAQ